MEKFDIKETKEMVKFLSRLISAGDAALADGNVNLMDAVYLLDPLRIAGSAVEGAKLIPAEASDLSEAELTELTTLISEELVIRDEFAKEITLDVVNMAGQLALLLRKIREHRQEQETIA
jgi:hypothetical protein